jgi:hypothetical protein
MHIHGSGMAPQMAGLYSTTGVEKAAAQQRAADVRKKLMSSAQQAGAASSPEEAFLIGQWTDSRHSRVQSDDQYHASAAGRNPDFG